MEKVLCFKPQDSDSIAGIQKLIPIRTLHIRPFIIINVILFITVKLSRIYLGLTPLIA